MKKNKLHLCYFIKGKIILYKIVDIFDTDFKKSFFGFIKNIQFIKVDEKKWESLILDGNKLILCGCHKNFYETKYNITYKSDMFLEHDYIKHLVNIVVGINGLNDTEDFLMYYTHQNNSYIQKLLTTICIQMDFALYQVFLHKKSKLRDPCIPGITSSKLIYQPRNS